MKTPFYFVAMSIFAACGTPGGEIKTPECPAFDMTGIGECEPPKQETEVAAIVKCANGGYIAVWTETTARYSSTDGIKWTCDPYRLCMRISQNEVAKRLCRKGAQTP